MAGALSGDARATTRTRGNPWLVTRDFTIATVPQRFAELGDLHGDIDDHVFDIAPLLAWADRDGLGS